MTPANRRPRQIDELRRDWRRRLAPGIESHLLPLHPWMGVRMPDPHVRVGATWTVCADLVAETGLPGMAGPRRLELRAPRFLIRHQGHPVAAEQVPELEGWWRPLALIPAGTQVRVDDTNRFSDPGYGFSGSSIWFGLPDGRQFSVNPEMEWMDPGDWVLWGGLSLVESPVRR